MSIWRYDMKTLLIATTIAALTISSVANADEVECTTTDVIVGVSAGAVGAVVIGVATVAASPLVGAGAAAGSTVGLSGALSAPVLAGSTLPSVAASSGIVGPILGVAGFYGSCVWNSVMAE
jgi:hypothetical protein